MTRTGQLFLTGLLVLTLPASKGCSADCEKTTVYLAQGSTIAVSALAASDLPSEFDYSSADLYAAVSGTWRDSASGVDLGVFAPSGTPVEVTTGAGGTKCGGPTSTMKANGTLRRANGESIAVTCDVLAGKTLNTITVVVSPQATGDAPSCVLTMTEQADGTRALHGKCQIEPASVAGLVSLDLVR